MDENLDKPRYDKIDPPGPSARDLEIYEYLMEGHSCSEAGAKFGGLCKQRISQIKIEVNKWLIPIFIDKIRDIKVEHTHRLNYVFTEAMAGWRRSQEEEIVVKETETTTSVGQHPGDTSTSSRTKKRPIGSVQFLSEARAALAEIRKIWGADAPVAAETDGADGPRVAGDFDGNKANWVDEQIAKLMAMKSAAPTN